MTLSHAMVASVDQPSLIGSGAAARAVGVHSSTLWRWVKEGHVTPTATTAGGQLRWDVEDLRRQVRALRKGAEVNARFRAPAPSGDRFAPDAFAGQVGKPFPHGGVLLAAEVVEDGAAALLTVSIRVPAAKLRPAG